MRRLLLIVAAVVGLSSSLAACDLPGRQVNNDFHQVGGGLNR